MSQPLLLELGAALVAKCSSNSSPAVCDVRRGILADEPGVSSVCLFQARQRGFDAATVQAGLALSMGWFLNESSLNTGRCAVDVYGMSTQSKNNLRRLRAGCESLEGES